MKNVDVDFERPELTTLQTLLNLLLGQRLRSRVNMRIDTFGDDRLVDDVTPYIQEGFTGFVDVELNLAVLRHGLVITLESVGVIVADALGQAVVDGSQDFLTGNQLDTVQTGEHGLNGPFVRLIEGHQVDAHQKVVTTGLAVLVGVGQTDVTATGFESLFHIRDDDILDDGVLSGFVHFTLWFVFLLSVTNYIESLSESQAFL